MTEIDIRPGALEEDPPEAAAPPPDEGSASDAIRDEIEREERNGEDDPSENRADGERKARRADDRPSGASGRPTESEKFDGERAREAIEKTEYAGMCAETGRPIFTKAELELIAKDHRKLSAKLKRERKGLLDRASKWRQRAVEEAERAHRDREAAIVNEKAREADLAALVAVTGEEPYKLANAMLDLAELSGIMSPAPELRFSEPEIATLRPDTAAVMLRYPWLSEWLLMSNVPEARLAAALVVVCAPKVASYRVRLAEAHARARA